MTERLDPALATAARYRHWINVTMRFRDLDILGHVNNVTIAGWLEDGRVALELPIQPLTKSYQGPVIVLADLRIQYHEEIHFGADVRVGTRVQRIGTTSVTLGQGVFVGSRCAAVAESVEVLLGAESRRPEPWPGAFRSLFEAFG